MRISDWSSDVCSSDLDVGNVKVVGKTLAEFDNRERVIWHDWDVQLGGKGVLQERAPPLFIEEAGVKIRPCGIDRANHLLVIDELLRHEIGSALWTERVCQYVWYWWFRVSRKKK